MDAICITLAVPCELGVEVEGHPSVALLYDKHKNLMQAYLAEADRKLAHRMSIKQRVVHVGGDDFGAIELHAVVALADLEEVQVGEAWVSDDWEVVHANITELTKLYDMKFYKGIPFWIKVAKAGDPIQDVESSKRSFSVSYNSPFRIAIKGVGLPFDAEEESPPF